jgi:hypothetical protein
LNLDSNRWETERFMTRHGRGELNGIKVETDRHFAPFIRLPPALEMDLTRRRHRRFSPD